MKLKRYSLTLLCGLLLSFFSNKGFSQITAWADSTGCSDTTVVLHAVLLGDVPTASGITADDGYSGLIPIGFTFNFYGTTYTNFLFGSNGMLCFDASLAGSYDPWPITAPLLGNSSALNSICGPWCDIYIPAGGTMTYSTIGTAPYRKFMATWCSTAMFDCTTQWTTTQIIMYETTNVVETHIGHHTGTTCTYWNGGYAIVGVQDPTGTVATVAPGRDYPSVWDCTDEAWRFTPDATVSTYSVSSIPYAPVPYASSMIYWYDSATHALIDSGSVIHVSPTVPTTYIAAAAGCSDTTFAYVHALPAGGSGGSGAGGSVNLHITSGSSTNPTACGVCDGTITLTGINPGQIDSVIYTYNGVLQPYLVMTASGPDSSITLTGLCAGVYGNIHVKVGNCISNAVTETLADPAFTAGFSTSIHLGCTHDSVFCTNTSTPPGYTCTWNFGDGSALDYTYDPVHIYSAQGTYTIQLNYTNGHCVSDTNETVTISHPLTSSFTTSANSVCLGTVVSFTNTSVANSPSYLWTFGDGGSSTLTNPVYNYLAGGNYTVTLQVTDFLNCVATSTTDISVIDVHIRTDFHDTIVCLRDSMPLITYTTVVPEPAITGLSYTWNPANNLGDPTAAIPNFLGIGNYTYTVSVSTVPLGCTATDVLNIHSFPPVVLTGVTASQTIANGSSIQLDALGATYYTWTPDNGTLDNPNINNPVATPVDSVTTYVVHGMSPYGCLDSAVITIALDYGGGVFIPMAFTPNNDGLNDRFRVSHLGLHKLVDMRVFDRWGREVFQTNDT